MTTARDVCEALLDYLSEDEQEIPSTVTHPRRDKWALRALNGAFQELLTLAPTWFNRDVHGDLLSGPVSVTVTPAAASTVTIAQADWLSWMAYGTVNLGGSIDNCGRGVTLGTGGNPHTLELMLPHELDGATTAIFYHDAVILPSTMLKVLRPVSLLGMGELVPVPNLLGLDAAALGVLGEDDYGADMNIPGLRPARLARSSYAGTPISYFIDTLPAAATKPVLLMRISPPPSYDMALSYRYKVGAPKYTDDDIEDAEDSPELPLPWNYIESILFPIASQRFTACPFWRNKEAKDEVGRQYQVAIKAVRDSRPQDNSGLRLRPPF